MERVAQAPAEWGLTDTAEFSALLRHGGRELVEPGAVDDLVAAKLWDNPCWFSFRINFLALNFNVPVYRWIEKTYGIQRAEFVVIYALGLKDGLTASAVSASSGFPKNTISRAIQRLLDRGIARREVDPTDLRSFVLYLTAEGRRIVDECTQPMVEREKIMLAGLTPAEQLMVSELLAKIVVNHPDWSTSLTPEEDEE
jgi:DNA-binding MarR family transcriptional regulator